ncbi:MAG: hypothetical protein Fur0042_15200 [Cyanophyceae cyanobacterium]
MPIDISQFAKAIDPSRTLVVSDPSDRDYYIDFASVRGGAIIEKIRNRIARLSPDAPTCSLFSGHIGCGKSTELQNLKEQLEAEGFFVVYFASTDDLEVSDVDIIDVLLVIAKQISEQLDALDALEIPAPGLRGLLRRTADILNTEIDVSGKLGIGDVKKGGAEVGFDTGKRAVTLGAGIGSLTVKAKGDAGLRAKLNQYLGPQKIELLNAINAELLEPAIAQIKGRGYRGLVAIIDNLDRIDRSTKSFGKGQQEYLFVDQGSYLRELKCHTIYTMPLSLMFSSAVGNLLQVFKPPYVLPMVGIRDRNGADCPEGLELMRQMVLARAFPKLSPEERRANLGEVFENEACLEALCRYSGGHVRDVLSLLSQWVEEEMDLPLAMDSLEDSVADLGNILRLQISSEEWVLLREVKKMKQVCDAEGFQQLIHTRMVFEYKEDRRSWFDINPILTDAEELQA